MTIGNYFGLELHLEVLLINLYLMIDLMVEPCVFDIYSSLWLIDALIISGKNSPVDIVFKLFTSLIVIVKCSARYIMLACQIMSMYPIFFEDLPDLLLPLVMVCIFRNIILNSLELFVGIVFCYYGLSPVIACTVFVFNLIFLIGSSGYYAFIVMRLYHSLVGRGVDDIQRDIIDNEDIIKNVRIKHLDSRKMKISLMNSSVLNKSYSDESVNMSVSSSNSQLTGSEVKSIIHVTWRDVSQE